MRDEALLPAQRLDPGKYSLRSERKLTQPDTGRGEDGVGDRRRHNVDRDLRDALGAERTGRLVGRDKDRFDGRGVDGREDLVVEKVRVQHSAALIEHHLLGQCVAEPHRHGAMDLALRERGVDRETAIDGTGEVLSRPFSLAYIGSWQGAGKSINFNIAPHVNIPGGSNGEDADYDDLRPGATADWSLVRYGFGYDQLLTGSWLFHLVVQGQHTSDQLISGEQFGVGGLYSVRGFNQRILIGDSGYQANFELWMPRFSSFQITPLVFIDYGHVEVNLPQLGETPEIDIASVGAGLRWNIKNKLNMVFDAAYVVDGNDEIKEFTGSDDYSATGDVKAHIDVFYRF